MCWGRAQALDMSNYLSVHVLFYMGESNENGVVSLFSGGEE